jgi:hypothetical protein
MVADHLGEADIVLNQQDALGHRRILTASPVVPEAPMLPELRKAIIDFAALLRGKHFAGVAEGLRETLARSVGQCQLFGPEGLDGAPIDGRLRQNHPSSLSRRNRLFPHGQKILNSSLDDGTELFLLVCGGIDLYG